MILPDAEREIRKVLDRLFDAMYSRRERSWQVERNSQRAVPIVLV